MTAAVAAALIAAFALKQDRAAAPPPERLSGVASSGETAQ